MGSQMQSLSTCSRSLRLRDEMAMECLDNVLDFLEACGKATAVGTLGPSRFFWCSSSINRTRALSVSASADSLLHFAMARPFPINLEWQIPIVCVDDAFTEGLAQYHPIFSQGSWMPPIQPWIDERKWKRRWWWLRGHRHGRCFMRSF